MRSNFHTVSKSGSGQVAPVRTLTLPNGNKIRVLRRDIYERALEKTREVIKEKGLDYNDPEIP